MILISYLISNDDSNDVSMTGSMLMWIVSTHIRSVVDFHGRRLSFSTIVFTLWTPMVEQSIPFESLELLLAGLKRRVDHV